MKNLQDHKNYPELQARFINPFKFLILKKKKNHLGRGEKNLLFIVINYKIYFISGFQLNIPFHVFRGVSQIKHFLWINKLLLLYWQDACLRYTVTYFVKYLLNWHFKPNSLKLNASWQAHCFIHKSTHFPSMMLTSASPQLSSNPTSKSLHTGSVAQRL